MTESVPEAANMRQPKTPADRAYLLRVIARTVTESLPAPMNIEMAPECGAVSLRFDDDQVAAVEAWADMLDVEVIHDQVGSSWHWMGNDDAGTPWHGWLLHVWCKVNGLTPGRTAAANVAQNPPEWPAAASAAADEPDVATLARPVMGLFAEVPVEFPRLIWPAPVQDPALREDEVAFA
ncbi:hypothetical protein [Micromonospora sp. CB01531]|uniref:hypothetical protein n=1 Tax=Micromonospora sp. CB01531 TaxID=1718947 RepID=UPI00093F7DDD|nr:hypothetical protein [Micromonospora sp. CB01531]OKI52876.1 hypothetical protein A6A27_08285 [Micromonospora sp. CB01531]